MRQISILVVIGFLAFQSRPQSLSAETLELGYSTYLGGSGSDQAYGLARDAFGSLYVTGETASFDFPTLDAYQGSNAYQVGGREEDAFVSKLSSSGDRLLFSTYLGGSDREAGNAIAVDSAHCPYLSGWTVSLDFPTLSAYQPSYSGIIGSGDEGDAFVSKLSSGGSLLLYSTYLGGREYDIGEAIAVDSSGGACVTGLTESETFPTLNAYQSSYGGWYGSMQGGLGDAFVTRVSTTGSALVFSTYLGGSHADSGAAIKLRSDGSLYVVGCTGSFDFPTHQPYQAAKPTGDRYEYDAFIALFSPDGSGLVSSTFFGGRGSEGAYGIALADDGFYISGDTSSFDFPTRRPYQQELAGSPDGFVSKFASMTDLSYSTYLGGSDKDYCTSIAIDSKGEAHVSGATQSLDFPLLSPYQGTFGGGTYDAFVSALSPDGTFLVYSSYLGGLGEDWSVGIALANENDAICIAGWTDSTDFPLRDPYQQTIGGSRDAFISVLKPAPQIALERGDYDGDGTADIAVFRKSSGLWSVKDVTRVYFGNSFGMPVPGDYSGDGTTAIGIFEGSTGLWALRDVTRLYLGSSSDVPVPGDYNGDGTCDPGIYRGSSGLWAVSGIGRAYFGTSGDIVVPGYYDGSMRKKIGIFRGASGLWALHALTRIYFGSLADSPVPGDYDGNGSWEVGVFRPPLGLWSLRDVTKVYFGGGTDQPVPADYDGDTLDDVGIFNGSSGLWTIRDITQAYYGAAHDVPVTR